MHNFVYLGDISGKSQNIEPVNNVNGKHVQSIIHVSVFLNL